MSQFDPNLTSEGSEEFDRLIAGDFDRETATVTVGAGQDLSRGAILGEGAGSEYFLTDDGTAADGRDDPKAILAEDVDTNGGAKEAPVYLTGPFNRAVVSVDPSTTVAAQEPALRDRSIFLKDTVSR